MLLIRTAALAYMAALTYLLLTPRPGLVLRFWFLPRGPGGILLHVTAFVGLGVLASASRFPLARRWLVGLLAAYAVGIELLQFLCPPRGVELTDALGNLLGLGVGLTLGELAVKYLSSSARDTMSDQQRYRLLTRESLATYDTYVLADPVPDNIKPDCVLVVHELTGRQMTVHRSRLVPADSVKTSHVDHERKSPCPTCGRVEGVVEDEVTCPFHGESPCVLVEKKE